MLRCLYLLQPRPLSLLIILLLGSFLQAQYIPPGELIAPNGPYVLTGQQLILVCSLNRSLPFTARDIYIEKGDGEFNGTTTVLDQYTVLMNDTVTSLKYDGRYLCWAGPELLGSKLVNVDYYPQPVQELRCVLHNWDGPVNLSWELGVQYVRQEDLNITLFYGDGNQACAIQNKTFCSIPVFYRISISARVEVKNTQANVTAGGELVTFNLLDHVKPGPCEVKWDLCRPGSNIFTLVWSHSRLFRPKMYRLRYSILQETSWQEINISRRMQNSDTELELQTFTLVGLRPNSRYRIKLDTRPLNQLDGSVTGYWSDAVERIITTLESAPLTGPLVTSGSFHQEGCVKGERNVTVYWQPPAVDDRNGVITEYKLTSPQTGEARVDGSTLMHVVRTDCRHNVHLRLYAKTNVSWSNNYSQLHIPPTPDEDTFVEVYAVVYERDVQVVWGSKHGQTTQYTVYWCEGDTLRHICTSQIQWQLVGVGQRDVMLPVRSSSSTLFGLSASEAGVSDGIIWSRCVVQNIVPTLKPSSPQIYEASERTSRRVTWYNARCLSGDKALITGYRLLVNFLNNNRVETYFNDTFNLSVSEYTLQGLQVNRKYSIQLQALSNAGEGPFSDVVYMHIQEDPGGDRFIIIVVLVPLTLAFALLALWCKRKEILSFAKKKEEIYLPKISSPKSSPTHDLLPDKSRVNTEVDTGTVAAKQYVSWTNDSGSGSGSGSGSACEKTTCSTWQTSGSESPNVPSASVEMTDEQITLTYPGVSLIASNPNADTPPTAVASQIIEFEDLQHPRDFFKHTQPAAAAEVKRAACVNNSDYISSPSQAVTHGSPAATGLSSSTESDSTGSKSNTNSATSYVKVTEQPSARKVQVKETTPSPAIVQPSSMQTFQARKNPGNPGYVQFSDINETSNV